MLLNNLGSHWHWRRFGGGLPGLVDEVQVAVHSGHLVQCEGVRTGVICRGETGVVGKIGNGWIGNIC